MAERWKEKLRASLETLLSLSDEQLRTFAARTLVDHLCDWVAAYLTDENLAQAKAMVTIVEPSLWQELKRRDLRTEISVWATAFAEPPPYGGREAETYVEHPLELLWGFTVERLMPWAQELILRHKDSLLAASLHLSRGRWVPPFSFLSGLAELGLLDEPRVRALREGLLLVQGSSATVNDACGATFIGYHGDDALFLTAAHCCTINPWFAFLTGLRSDTVRTPDGQLWPARIVAGGREEEDFTATTSDYAIMAVHDPEGRIGEMLQPAALAQAAPSGLVGIYSPLWNAWDVVIVHGPAKLFRYHARAGFSGSPIFDPQGRVVGVVSNAYTLVPVAALAEDLRALGIPVEGEFSPPWEAVVEFLLSPEFAWAYVDWPEDWTYTEFMEAWSRSKEKVRAALQPRTDLPWTQAFRELAEEARQRWKEVLRR